MYSNQPITRKCFINVTVFSYILYVFQYLADKYKLAVDPFVDEKKLF